MNVKSKVAISFIVFSIVSSLLFQNCTKLTAFSKVSSEGQNPLEAITSVTLVSENNGEGYLGKPNPTEYVKSLVDFSCASGSNANASNIQGSSVYDGEKVVITNDNCLDLNYTVPISESKLNIQPYNPELFSLNGIPYEKKSVFLEDGSLATEVFCRDLSEQGGIDIIVKYENPFSALVKIFLGSKSETGDWVNSKVSSFNVNRIDVPYTVSNSAFKLYMSSRQVEDGLQTAFVDMILDQKQYSKRLSCYVMNRNPTIPSVADPSLIAQWGFNKTVEELVNNLSSVLIDEEGTFDYMAGIFDIAAYFNPGHRVQVAPVAPINGLSAMTISVWVQGSVTGNLVHKALIEIGMPGVYSGWGFEIHDLSKQLQFKMKYTEGELSFRSLEVNLLAEQWNHIVMTWNGLTTTGSVNFYVNGVQAFSELVSTPGEQVERSNDSQIPLVIGHHGIDSPFFAGRMDQLTIWNRALSQTEVQSLFLNGIPTP